jgi:hypothetical protein
MDETNWTTNSFSTGDFSYEDFQQAVRESEAIRQEILRSSSRMVEDTVCPICKRKPTVCNEGFGDTIVLCPHLMYLLKLLAKQGEAGNILSTFGDPFTVRFEVFDDGPRRW